MPGVPPARFAYLGPEGTFTEAALRQLPAAAPATLEPCTTVPAALDAVRGGAADGAMVPLENSVEGSVSATLDELATGAPLVITREVLLPVTFALLARPGTELAAVSSVATHPHAEAQCRAWLRSRLPGATIAPAPSTADAARAVARGQYDAAIAAPLAGERYALAALATGIGDSSHAVTRFVLLTRPGPPPAPTGADRTSLVAYIADNHAGALLEVLTEFAVRGIDLSRIESRPTGERLGRYCFSIDLAGHVEEARVGEALTAVRRICADVRFLGSYPRADEVASTPPAGTTDRDFADARAWLAAVRQGTGG